MSKVFIFLANGHEEIEALTVVDMLRRASIDIETVSITGTLNVEGSHGIKLLADKVFEDINVDEADMLVLPGGMPGTLNLEAYSPLMKAVDKFNGQGKYISAICAAPTVFGRRGLLNNKNACCYPDMEGDLKGAMVSYENVVLDGNILTSRGMGTAIDFALAIIEIFQGKNVAEDLAKKIVYSK